MGQFEVKFGKLKKYHGDDAKVIIEEGITHIDAYAFKGNEAIEEVVLPRSLTAIGDYAFYGCKNLKHIENLETVEEIGDGAFSCCYELTKIQLPEQLTYISKSLFYKCMQLKEVQLPQSIRVIENRAFSFCTSLQTIQLPDGIYKLGDSVFEECTSLKEITYPQKLTFIGNKTFFHCPCLQEIRLSSFTKSVGEAALQTHGKVTILSNDDLVITPQMLDYNYNLNWNYSFKFKNGENYQLVNSYLPHIALEEFKPQTKVIFLTNFLETYDLHKDPAQYEAWCHQYGEELLAFLIKEKRYRALNAGLDHRVIEPDDVTKYLPEITDREEKAKLMEYQSHHEDHSVMDLEKELWDLF